MTKLSVIFQSLKDEIEREMTERTWQINLLQAGMIDAHSQLSYDVTSLSNFAR